MSRLQLLPPLVEKGKSVSMTSNWVSQDQGCKFP
jgi:hypothetical protein